MLTSMTGFGRTEVSLLTGRQVSGRVVVEIRSVNHRFLEIETRLPEGFQSLEEEVRALVGRHLRRGQVRVSVSLKWSETLVPVEFSTAQALRYLKQLRALERAVGLRDTVTLEMLIGLPQVMKTADREPPSGKRWRIVRGAVEQALAHLVRMRRQEGARLQRALLAEMGTLAQLSGKIRRRAPVIHRNVQKRLARRIETLLRGSPAPKMSHSAVLAEAGTAAQAADVSEELARIGSHLSALTKAMQASVSNPGRTIDFLAQELQREVNTLGTKLRDGAVVHCVVAMKGQIEKLREQAANLE